VDHRQSLFRAALFHTPRNPFYQERALEAFSDGGLLVQDGRILRIGDYTAMQAAYPGAPTVDMRGGFILPGFIDTHTHFPQVRGVGGLGYTLMDWLQHHTLPEEARMADVHYSAKVAAEFVRALASHGTTTALVFGSHFRASTELFFETAAKAGLRIFSGMVLSDRRLRPELHQSPDAAYLDSKTLISRFHGEGRLGYAVTPRFALSCSEAMLEVCTTLLNEHPGVLLQTHLNESDREVREVREIFPWATDYLAVYQRFGLVNRRSIFAHSVHSTHSELMRLCDAGSAVAHCPCSNAALGSGFFPMRAHLEAHVPFALGTDVGGGIGFGMLKESLQAYLLQRLSPAGFPLEPAHMLYLATLAGAEALGVAEETGDLSPGKSADFVYLRPDANSPLASVLERAENHDRILAALFTLGSAEIVREVRVAGDVVYPC
jgi:guanine deaminase